MSTDSLISCCNRVLLNCGERPILNTNNTTGVRVKNVLRSAFTDVQTLYDWSWNRSEVTASNWSGSLATVENMQRLKGVIYRDTTYVRVLRSEPYVSTLRRWNYIGKPEFFSLVNENTVAVYPYPSTVLEQGKVIFQVVSWLSLPVNDADIIPRVPNQFVDLIVERASAMFAVQQNNDLALAQAFNANYETLAQRLRDRYRNVPTDGLQMYRGFR